MPSLLGHLVLICFLGSPLAPTVCHAQWLQGLRNEVREPPADPNHVEEPPPQDRQDHQSQDNRREERRWQQSFADDDEGTLGEQIGDWFVTTLVTSPFWVPARLAHDDYTQKHYFARTPYANHCDGLMVPGNSQEFISGDVRGYSVMARLRGEFGHNLEDLKQTQLHGLFESSNRLGVDGAISYRHESIAGGNDELLTGDLNVLFRFAQSPRLQMRAGAGVNWLHDDEGTEAGVNFTYGGDLFIADPWVVSAELDAGSLGDSGLFHFRATVGVLLNNVEIYTGYDRYDVDSYETNQWVTGVGIWF